MPQIHDHTYERTAEVGLLTRLITIEGVMDPGKFGSQFSVDLSFLLVDQVVLI